MKPDRLFSTNDKFKFSCHSGLACFNTCCRDINIFLTPYDVLRLKQSLEMTSGEFLTRFTHIIQPGAKMFPLVMINMDESEEKNCPFLSAQGCSVYQDRPWSCRMAPVDIRGDNQYTFCFDSSRCHGLTESQEWTVNEWMVNQGADVYQKMDAEFKEIPLKLKFTGFAGLDKHIREMFFMACYDLDKFRRFIFESSFIKVFNVSSETAESIKTDDFALMKYGLHWLADEMDLKKSAAVKEEVSRLFD